MNILGSKLIATILLISAILHQNLFSLLFSVPVIEFTRHFISQINKDGKRMSEYYEYINKLYQKNFQRKNSSKKTDFLIVGKHKYTACYLLVVSCTATLSNPFGDKATIKKISFKNCWW